jgi:3',5'-cyclic AMP phosphodiesterase CpdA
MISTVFVLLLLAITTTLPVFAYAEDNITITIPEPYVEAKLAKGLILQPRFAAPAFVEPGGTFTIVLSKPGNVSRIFIDDGYGDVYDLEFVRVDEKTYRATIPENAKTLLYDLFIEYNGAVYGEPHAVVVATKEMLEKVFIVHVTDRHFGVINSNGKEAWKYDLAVNLLSLGLPGFTIIVDTGDLADTAAPVEYEQSLMTDYILYHPLVGVPGNHDHVGGLKNYIYYRGPWNYTIGVLGLYRFIGIDSGGEGYINTDQATWAKKILESTREPVKIIMFHHPHFTHMFGDIQFNFTVNSVDELYSLLTSKKPNSQYMYIYSSWLQNTEALKTFLEGLINTPAERVLIFSGHVHLNSYAEVHTPDGKTIQYIVTVTTGGSIRPQDYHGFRVIELSSDGSVKIYGEGPYYTRGSSFNTEYVEAHYVQGPSAVTVYFKITNKTKIIDLLDKTVLALYIPPEYYGKTVNVYKTGIGELKLRCTPLGCVLYGYSPSPPEVGKEYQLTVYTAEDKENPTIQFIRMIPSKPKVGRQVTLYFKVSDDAWGVASIEAVASYNGKEIKLIPSLSGNMLRITISQLDKEVDKLKLTVRVVDASGKEVSFTKEITYIKPSPTKTVTTPTTTTSIPQTETQTTTTTTTQTTHVTITTKPPTTTITTTETTTTKEKTTTPTTAPLTRSTTAPTTQSTIEVTEKKGITTDTIVVTVLIIAAIAFLVFIVRRRA